MAGGGVNYADANKELVAFAERYRIPVVSTLLGLGAMPIEHELSLSMGMHGSYAANMAMDQADYIINIGARFDDRLTGNPTTYAPNATVAHIDIDPAEIGKVVKTAIPVVGDAKATLKALLALETVETGYADWTAQALENKRRAPFWYDEDEKVIKPQAAIELIGQLTQGMPLS